MIILLSVAQFFLILLICIEEVKHKSPAAFMWATLLMMFGISHMVTCMSSAMQYSEKTINEASAFVILFCGMYLTIRLLLWHKSATNKLFYAFDIDTLNREESIENKKISTKRLALFFYFVILLQLFTHIRAVGGVNNISWGSIYAWSLSFNYFNWDTILQLLYFSIGGIVCCQIINRDRKGVFVSALLIIVFIVIDGGNRVIVLPLVVSIISYYIFITRKLRLRSIVLACVFGVLSIILVYGILVLRHHGNMIDSIKEMTLLDIAKEVILYIQSGKGELGLKNIFYYFLDRNNEFANFGKGHTYIRMLLVYFPTRLTFGLKPDDFAKTMGMAIGMGTGGGAHPTLFGDCYANFNWFGVFMGFFWAIYVSIMDYVASNYKTHYFKIMMYVLLGYSYVIIGRGSVYNGFFSVAWGIPILAMIEWISLKTTKVNISFGRRTLYQK